MRTSDALVVLVLLLVPGHGVGAPARAEDPTPGAAPAWTRAARDRPWSFPRDHWAHPEYKTEWWYFTGRLESDAREGAPPRRFGFQFTLFRIGLAPRPPDLDSAFAANALVMGHAAITDLESGTHVFSEAAWRASDLFGGFGAYPDPRIAWCRPPLGSGSGRGDWELRWNGFAFDLRMHDDRQGIALELSTRPEKPLVLQGDHGFSSKTASGESASLYYSFTRLAARGSVLAGGVESAVTGEAWMDKEFSSGQLAANQVGWDWFSLRLDDGRDLMLYALRDELGRVDHASGTVVDALGTPRMLERGDFSLQPDETFESPATGARYPSAYAVRVPSERLVLRVVPATRAAENVSALLERLFYFEGPVDVRDETGSSVGRGYLELTGYGADNRLPL